MALTTTGGTGAITYSLAPASTILPPGLSVNDVLDVISGTATTTGYYNFEIRAVDAAGQQALKALAIFVPNQGPTATPQSISTAEDTPAAITLAGSDTENDPLTFRQLLRPTQ